MKSRLGTLAVLLLPLVALAGGSAPRVGESNIARSGVPPAPKFQERARVARRIPFTSGDTILIRNRFGNVRVSTGQIPEINVNAELIAGGDTKIEAQNCLRKLQVVAERQGRRTNISVTCPEADQLCAAQFQTNFDLVLPADAQIRIENSYGDVGVDNVRGALAVQNRFGATTVRDGQRTEISNAFGDVNVERLAGDLTVRNQFGNVKLRGVTGTCQAVNETGNLRLTEGSGVIRLTNKLGDLFVTKTSGRIQISCSQGQVTFEQDNVNPDTVSIINWNGEIQLRLPAAASASINARATNGRIETSLPGAMPATGSDYQGQTFSCKLGAGLSVFALETSNSRILIEGK